MNYFEVGDRVKWSSQAGGGYTEKSGVVVLVLKSSDALSPLKRKLTLFPSHRFMADGNRIPGGADRGYLVEVKMGPKAKPRLYMPYPNKLETA